MSNENKKALERSTRNINRRYNANDSSYRRSGPIGDSLAYRIFASREEIDRMKNILLSSDMKTYEKNKEYIESVSKIFTQYSLIRESIDRIYQAFNNAIKNNDQMSESEIKDIILNGKKVPNLNYYIDKDGYVTDVIVPKLKQIYDEVVQNKINDLDEKISSLKQEVFERYDESYKITDTYLSKSIYDNTTNSLISTKFVVDYRLSAIKENIGFEIYTVDGVIEKFYRDEDYDNPVSVNESTFTLIPTENEINKNKPIVYEIESVSPIFVRPINDKAFNFIDIVIPYVLYEYDLETSKGIFLTNNDSFNVFETKSNTNENENPGVYNIFKLNNNPYNKFSSITEPNEVVDLFIGNNNGGKLFLTTKTKDTVVKRNSIDNNPEFPFIIKSDKNQIGDISVINNRGDYKENDKNKYKTSQYKIGSENIDTIEMVDTYDTEVDVGNSGEIIDNLEIINKIPTDVINLKNIDNGNTFVAEFSGSSTPPEWSEDSEGDSYDDVKWDTVHFVTNGRIRWRRGEVSTCARNSTGTYNITLNNGETYENCKLIREGDPCVLMRSLTMDTSDPNYELKNNLGLYDEGIFRLSSSGVPAVDRYDPTSQNNKVNTYYKWYEDNNYANLDKFITIGSKVPFSENLNGPMTEANYGYVTAIDLITQTMTIYNPATSSSKTICYKMFGDETKLKYVKVKNTYGNFLSVTSVRVVQYRGQEVYKTNNDTTEDHYLDDFVFVDLEVQNADFLFGPGINNNGNTDAMNNSNYCMKSELGNVRRSHFSDNIYFESSGNTYGDAAISKFGGSGYIYPRYLFDASKIKGYMDSNYDYAKSYFITSVPDSYSNKGTVERDPVTKKIKANISDTTTVEVNKCIFLDGYYTTIENPENGSLVAAILKETNDKEFTFEYAHDSSIKYKLKLSSQGTHVDIADVAYITTNNASVPIITAHEINGQLIIDNESNEASVDFTYNNTKYKVNIPRSNITYKSDIAIVTNKTSGVSVLRTSITDYLLGSDKTLNIKVGSTTHSNLNILKIGDAVLYVNPKYKFNQFMYEPLIIKSVSSSGVSGVYYNSVKGTLTNSGVTNAPISKLGIPYDSKTFYTSDNTTSKIVSINKENRTVKFVDGKTISYYVFSNTDMIKNGYLYVDYKSKVIKTITQVDWNKFNITYTDGTSATNVARGDIIFNESLFMDFDYILTDPVASNLTTKENVARRTLLKDEITEYRISNFTTYLIIVSHNGPSNIVFSSIYGTKIGDLCKYKITNFDLESILGITTKGDANYSLKTNYLYPMNIYSGYATRDDDGSCKLNIRDSVSGNFTVPLTYAYACRGNWCMFENELHQFQSYDIYAKQAIFYTADGVQKKVSMYSTCNILTDDAAYVLDNTITGHIITEDELGILIYRNGGYVASFTDRNRNDEGYLRWVKLSRITGEEYKCESVPLGNTDNYLRHEYSEEYLPYISKEQYESIEFYDATTDQYQGVIFRTFSNNGYYYDMLVPGINNIRVIECKVLKRSSHDNGYINFGNIKNVFIENPNSATSKIICIENEALAASTQFPDGRYDEKSYVKYKLDWLLQGDSHEFRSDNYPYWGKSCKYSCSRQGTGIFGDPIAFCYSSLYDYDFGHVYGIDEFNNPIDGESYWCLVDADIAWNSTTRKSEYKFGSRYKYATSQNNFAVGEISNINNNLHLVFLDKSGYILGNAK